LAPDVELLSFRAYGDGKETASSYSITMALWEAANAECDLVNLSMETLESDTAMEEAIKDANAHGIVVIGAAGNGGRQPVVSPARYGVAVTALGRAHTFPAGSLEESQVAAPTGSDPDDFLAGFSNVGLEVTFVAPGLGVVSTVPGGYAPETGTSMAAAALTGIAARLLSSAPGVMAMRRDRNRSKTILELLTKRARAMGLGPTCEGFGML
jgi:subtilisin